MMTEYINDPSLLSRPCLIKPDRAPTNTKRITSRIILHWIFQPIQPEEHELSPPMSSKVLRKPLYILVFRICFLSLSFALFQGLFLTEMVSFKFWGVSRC